MPTRRPDNGPLLALLHPPECAWCGEACRYGLEIEADETDEAEIRGDAGHVACWTSIKRRLRVSRAVGAFLAWAGA